MPTKLLQAIPKESKSSVFIVIFGKTITGQINANEIAPHIGLVIWGKFADFCSFGDRVTDYTAYYSCPWYYDTGITLDHDKGVLEKIEKLSASWGAMVGEMTGTHSAWPYNCRSYVAYVLKVLLHRAETSFPGLGAEIKDLTKLGAVQVVGDKLLK